MPKEAQGLGNRVSPSGVNRGEHLRTNGRCAAVTPGIRARALPLGHLAGKRPGMPAWRGGKPEGSGGGPLCQSKGTRDRTAEARPTAGLQRPGTKRTRPTEGPPRGHEPQGAGASGVRVSIWEVPRKRGGVRHSGREACAGQRRGRRAVQDGRPGPAGKAPSGLARSAGCRPHRFPSWSWNRLCGDGPWRLQGKCCSSNRNSMSSPLISISCAFF